MNSILQETKDYVLKQLKEEEKIVLEDCVFGLFFSGAKLSTGEGGLCVTPVKMMPEAVCCPSSAKLMPNPSRMKGRDVVEILEDLESKSILKKTLAIAVLNALTKRYFDKSHRGIEVLEDQDAFDMYTPKDKEKAVVIGALIPIIKRLKKEGITYKILEKDPRTLKGDEINHYYPAEEYVNVLEDADVVYITGTTILNDTIDGLLKAIPEKSTIIIAGPTVSLYPEPFLQRGVEFIGSDMVQDPDKMLEVLSLGGSGYHLFGKSCERVVLCQGKEK
ncbi:MAG: DUF364 domain-containing protein [Tissierellia bacterium]|nr:DUF364 domain-containing protein [Tissierellia bacterium]